MQSNARGDLPALCTLKGNDCFGVIRNDPGAAMGKLLTTQLASEGNIGEFQFGVRVQMGGEIVDGMFRGSFRLC